MASIGEIGWATAIYYHPIETDPDHVPGTPATDANFTSTAKKLAQVRNFDGLQQEADEIDITNFDSPNATRETIAGLLSSGSATMELVYSPAEVARYWTATNTLLRLTRWWQVRIPATIEDSYSYCIFSGQISAFGLTVPVDDVVVCPITMQVGGSVIFTAAT